jgi:hypothetical protein
MHPGISWGLANSAAVFRVKSRGKSEVRKGRVANTEAAFLQMAASSASGLISGDERKARKHSITIFGFAFTAKTSQRALSTDDRSNRDMHLD